MKRLDPTEDDAAEFARLFAKVPVVVTEHRVWQSAEGEAFLTALLRYRKRGGQVKPLEQAMGIHPGYLSLVQRHATERQVRARKARRRASNG